MSTSSAEIGPARPSVSNHSARHVCELATFLPKPDVLPQDSPLVASPPRSTIYICGEDAIEDSVRRSFRHRLAEQFIKCGATVDYSEDFAVLASRDNVIVTVLLKYVPYQQLVRLDPSFFIPSGWLATKP
jgi:hypothetical protein